MSELTEPHASNVEPQWHCTCNWSLAQSSTSDPTFNQNNVIYFKIRGKQLIRGVFQSKNQHTLGQQITTPLKTTQFLTGKVLTINLLPLEHLTLTRNTKLSQKPHYYMQLIDHVIHLFKVNNSMVFRIFRIVRRSTISVRASPKELHPHNFPVIPTTKPWQCLLYFLSMYLPTFHTNRIKQYVLVCDWPLSFNQVFKVHPCRSMDQ